MLPGVLYFQNYFGSVFLQGRKLGDTLLLAHCDSDAKSEEASKMRKMEMILFNLLIFNNKETKPKALKIHPFGLCVECLKNFTC